MITQQALQEAIAECQGVKSPNRETCMMLAAFYTIQDHLYPQEQRQEPPVYSYSGSAGEFAQAYFPAADTVGEYGDSEFLRAVAGRDPVRVWAVLDELMDTVRLIQPRLYDSVMSEILE